MKVIWSSKKSFDECPRCDSVMVEAGKKMICPTCGIKEIERLQKLVKRLTKRALDTANAEPAHKGTAQTAVPVTQNR
jgi:predicted RNA-binding Zn-ribbon protein involved in translation (DUF1610 family)